MEAIFFLGVGPWQGNQSYCNFLVQQLNLTPTSSRSPQRIFPPSPLGEGEKISVWKRLMKNSHQRIIVPSLKGEGEKVLVAERLIKRVRSPQRIIKGKLVDR